MNESTSLLGRIMSKTGLWKGPAKKERRRSMRYKIDLPIRFRIFLPSSPSNSTPFLSARLYDISLHGLGLLTDNTGFDDLHMIDPHHLTSEKCHLEIEIPYDEKPLLLRGTAVWYIRHPTGLSYLYRVGIEFQGLSDATRRHLQTLINLYASATQVA